MISDPNASVFGVSVHRLAKISSVWRATVLRYLGFSTAKARDVDREQAVIRAVIAGFVLVYASYVLLSDAPTTFSPLIAVVCAIVVETAGWWQLWWYRRHTERPAWMRYFGIAADLIPLTVGLWAAGEPGSPAIGVYLWVTVGNGFRFGTPYLLASYWTSLACFAVIVATNPFWRQHLGVGIGFSLVLAVVPLYVLVLLSRLTAQKDAAIELSNAKSRFVANVSHELRTPLAGVFAVYDLLRRRRLPSDEHELVGSLGSAIATLRSSVDDVLQMSKLEAGAERAERRLFNLRRFLQQIALLVKPQAVARRLSWQLNIEDDVPVTVVGDSTHLQHVLGNLINNALKFTSEGSVTLRVQSILGGVRFEVSDTGIGIPLDKQESLFDRFVQADASATRRFGGTGLGTSIARDLVELMGGAIGVSSAPGHGAMFWVELPLSTPDSTTEADLSQEHRQVLIIGPPSDARDLVEISLDSLQLKLDVRSPEIESPPSFNDKQFLVALVVMPPNEAAIYCGSLLRDCVAGTCPWLAVSPMCSTTQAAALLKSGAAAILSPKLSATEWRVHIAALAARFVSGPDIEEMPPPSIAHRLHILLADDNESNRMLTARILSNAGHTVSHAGRGDQAYDLMMAGNVDIAILDLNMPELSGLDATKLFRAGEVGGKNRLPIIIMSADATSAARDDSLDAGANDYIVKPITAAAFLGMIERTMAGVRSRQGDTVLGPTTVKPTVGSQLVLVPSAARRELPVPALVDSERISALRRIASQDVKFLIQYSDAAFQDLELALRELREALQSTNALGARDAIHKIDGTAASVGAVGIVQAAKSMRQYLSLGLDSDAAAALAELVSTCALTKSTISAMLREPHSSDRLQ